MLALSLASIEAVSIALSSVTVLLLVGLVSEGVGLGGDSEELFNTPTLAVGEPAKIKQKNNKNNKLNLL